MDLKDKLKSEGIRQGDLLQLISPERDVTGYVHRISYEEKRDAFGYPGSPGIITLGMEDPLKKRKEKKDESSFIHDYRLHSFEEFKILKRDYGVFLGEGRFIRKYFTETTNFNLKTSEREEITNEEEIERWNNEIIQTLQKLNQTATPAFLSSSSSYEKSYVSFGFWAPFCDNSRNPCIDLVVSRSSKRIYKKEVVVAEMIKYSLRHQKRGEPRRIIFHLTEGEPQSCWIKEEYDLMKQRAKIFEM